MAFSVLLHKLPVIYVIDRRILPMLARKLPMKGTLNKVLAILADSDDLIVAFLIMFLFNVVYVLFVLVMRSKGDIISMHQNIERYVEKAMHIELNDRNISGDFHAYRSIIG